MIQRVITNQLLIVPSMGKNPIEKSSEKYEAIKMVSVIVSSVH